MRANPLSRESQARIVAHMNQDHSDALRGYLATADGVTMLGIDAEGIDLKVKDRLCRIPLARAIGTEEEAREVLVEMTADRR